MSGLVTVFIGVVAGAIGWLFTNLIFHPWIQVQELRRKSRFETIYWNVMVRSQTLEQGAVAREALRRVAFELAALDETSPHWFKRLLKVRSYDLAEAAAGMVCLSYETVGNIDFPRRALARHRVEKALALKTEFSDADCEKINARWEQERSNPVDDEPGPDPIDGLFM